MGRQNFSGNIYFQSFICKLDKNTVSSYHCSRSSPLNCQRAKLTKILTSRGNVTPTFVDCMQARVNVKMCLSMMVQVQTNSSPSYVPHFLPFVHLSNPDELYNLHLKLIMMSHDHLQNLETVLLLHPAERIKQPRTSFASLSLFKTNLKTYLFNIY